MIETHVMLYAMFFALLSAFMSMVAAGVFIVGYMRVVRLHTQGQYTGLSPVVIRQNLQQVASPLDQLTPWYTPSPFDSGLHPAVSPTANHTPGPLILPLRVQDTLLYADSIGKS
jgi:hypothetical protein